MLVDVMSVAFVDRVKRVYIGPLGWMGRAFLQTISSLMARRQREKVVFFSDARELVEHAVVASVDDVPLCFRTNESAVGATMEQGGIGVDKHAHVWAERWKEGGKGNNWLNHVVEKHEEATKREEK